MIKIREIEKVISGLPPEELAEFRTWFQKFDAAEWDKQFDEDARTGKLAFLADKAREDFKNGKCKEL